MGRPKKHKPKTELEKLEAGIAAFTWTHKKNYFYHLITMPKLVKYSKEFKLDALNLLQEGKSLSDIFNSLDISEGVSKV